MVCVLESEQKLGGMELFERSWQQQILTIVYMLQHNMRKALCLKLNLSIACCVYKTFDTP